MDESTEVFLTSPIQSEYEAVRSEILQRLGFQQQLLSYSFLTAGLLAPILTLYDVLEPGVIVSILLLGPVICMFLELIYVKQHAFIDVLSNYISDELRQRVIVKNDLASIQRHPYAGWENYLSSSLYVSKRLNRFTSLLGYAEGGFPALIGVIYLVAFVGVLISRFGDLAAWYSGLMIVWAIVDLLGLIGSVAVGIQVRGQISLRRQENVQGT